MPHTLPASPFPREERIELKDFRHISYVGSFCYIVVELLTNHYGDGEVNNNHKVNIYTGGRTLMQ